MVLISTKLSLSGVLASQSIGISGEFTPQLYDTFELYVAICGTVVGWASTIYGKKIYIYIIIYNMYDYIITYIG